LLNDCGVTNRLISYWELRDKDPALLSHYVKSGVPPPAAIDSRGPLGRKANLAGKAIITVERYERFGTQRKVP
jgi:hypothetical protein